MDTLKKIYIALSVIIVFTGLIIYSQSCSTAKVPVNFPTDTLYTNKEGKGYTLELSFKRGEAHNHPLMAIWITDTTGKYIETLYIAESVGKGFFDHVNKSAGKWQEGVVRRPATLPVWAHSRNVVEKDGLYIPTPETVIPDAITGATPQNNFVLIAKTSSKSITDFDIYFEINQTWDWNEFWTNSKYPDDLEYKTSCQPALVYKARINLNKKIGKIPMDLIGRSSFNGSDGKIYTDLETITTAKNISLAIYVTVLQR